MPLPPISKRAVRHILETSERVARRAHLVREVPDEVEPHLTRHLMLLQQHEFTSPFDWQAEYREGHERLEDPDYIAQADLEELRKIMTAHIRIDRMSDGHLDRLVERGFWNHCLERLAQLHDEMDED